MQKFTALHVKFRKNIEKQLLQYRSEFASQKCDITNFGGFYVYLPKMRVYLTWGGER